MTFSVDDLILTFYIGDSCFPSSSTFSLWSSLKLKLSTNIYPELQGCGSQTCDSLSSPAPPFPMLLQKEELRH